MIAENKTQINDGDLIISNNVDENVKKLGRFGVRHIQALLLFFCLTCSYSMRVNLSVAIVSLRDCESIVSDNEKTVEEISQLLLSSFFWGYVVSQIPAGQLAERYGTRFLLLVAVFLCSVLTLFCPLGFMYGGWKALVVLRVLAGLCQGFIFPSTHNLLSKWAPISERAHLVTYTYSGCQLGSVLMLSTSGILTTSAVGWPSIFYFSGAIGVAWSIVWFFFGCNSPDEHKNISIEEKQLIDSTPIKDNVGEGAVENNEPKLKTPWIKIFTSLPFIAVIVAHSAHNWGFWTLLTELPTYMKNILGFDIEENALLSALPYFAMMVTSYFFSYISDVLQHKKCIPLTLSRKIFNSLGHWTPAITLIVLAYVSADQKYVAVALLVVTVGINSATYLGFQCNHIDLSPNFAGTLMGITNCAANIMSIIAPLTVGQIVKNVESVEQWRIVLFILAAIYFVGNSIFIIFCKTDVQSWNNLPAEETPPATHDTNLTQGYNESNRRI